MMRQQAAKPYLMAVIAAALAAALAACEQSPATPATVSGTHKVTVIGPHTINTSGFTCTQSANGNVCGTTYQHAEITDDAVNNRLITVEFSLSSVESWSGLPFILSVGTADYTLDYYLSKGKIGFVMTISDSRLTRTALSQINGSRYRIKIAE